jgi:hypothetical protein
VPTQPPPPPSSQPPSKCKDPNRSGFDRSVQVEIGRLLKDAYSEVTLEPVPDRFIRFLETLKDKEECQ